MHLNKLNTLKVRLQPRLANAGLKPHFQIYFMHIPVIMYDLKK